MQTQTTNRRNKMMGSRQPWTKQQLQSLNGLKTGRTTVQQLSQRFGRSPGAIRQQAHQQGISINTRGTLKGNRTQHGSTFRTAASKQKQNRRTTQKRTATG